MNGIRLFGRPLGLILLVLYEAIVGLVKTAFGIILLVGTYTTERLLSSQLVERFITRELNEDPQDLFANWFLKQNLVGTTVIHIGWFLLAFGIINFVIAIGIWFRSWAIRNIGLIFFGIIGIFGVSHLYFRFSLLEFIGWVIDVFILYYFWKMLPKHLSNEHR